MRKVRGFTLVELLTVIGILAILVSMLMPMFGKVRAIANTTKCASNLRQIGFGNQQFALDHGGYGAGGGHIDKKPDGTGGSSVAWQNVLSIEQFGNQSMIPRGGANGQLFCPVALSNPLTDTNGTQARSYAINSGLSTGGPVYQPYQFQTLNIVYKKVTGKNWNWDAYNLGAKLSDWRNPQKKIQFSETDRGADGLSGGTLTIGSPGYFPWTANSSWSFRHGFKANMVFLDNHVELVPYSANAAAIQNTAAGF